MRRVAAELFRPAHVATVLIGVTVVSVFPARSGGASELQGPTPPPGASDLLEFQFEPEQIDGDELANVLDPTGWLNGEILGSVMPVAGHQGQALHFDGSENVVVIPESERIDFRRGVYVEAAVNVDADASGVLGIVSKWYPDQWALAINTDAAPYGKIDFTVRLDDGSPDGIYYVVDYYFPDPSYLGSWITIAGVYDPAVGIQVFLNDVPVADDPIAGLLIVDSYANIRVGDLTEWTRFDGAIDDVLVWGDFTPAPSNSTRLIRYDFDLGQVDGRSVDNLIVAGTPWMDGWLEDGRVLDQGPPTITTPDLVPGANGYPGDQAVRLNVPWDYSTTLDYAEAVNSGLLTFTQGILVNLKMYLEDELYKGANIIASQMVNTAQGTNHWRLAIDYIDGEGYNLTFMVWLVGVPGLQLVKVPLPADHVGRWIDVAASYDPTTATGALFWDRRRVKIEDDLEVGSIPTEWDPIRIGMAEDSNPTSAFEGSIDDFHVWGDVPGCSLLTTAVSPGGYGSVDVYPTGSLLPEFCALGPGIYTRGEVVRLEAIPSSGKAFYEWQGPLAFIGGFDKLMDVVDITLLTDTTATAMFWPDDDPPTMELFPLDTAHNTGFESSCGGTCPLECGAMAKAVSNSDCHVGGVDIFATSGDRVMAAQGGEVRFRCDSIGGNVAEIVSDWDGYRYMYYYAHLDGVCFRNAAGQIQTNLCTSESLCDGCEVYEPEGDTVCPVYFEHHEQVMVGDMLGTIGVSGNATATQHHLHFGIGDYDHTLAWSCAHLNPFPFIYPLEGEPCSDRIYTDWFESGDLRGWSAMAP